MKNTRTKVGGREKQGPICRPGPDVRPGVAKSSTAPIASRMVFDRDFYVRENPDVLMSGLDPATHYRNYGCMELRAPNPDFNPRAYLVANPDLQGFAGDLFLHYIFYGANEGRLLR
jgi:hypothetical protein